MRVAIGYVKTDEPNAPLELCADFYVAKLNKYLQNAIISDRDCCVDAKLSLSNSCNILNIIDYKTLTDTGFKCVFEFYICGENGFIFKKRFYADSISLSLSSKMVRTKLYSNIILGGNNNE